MHVPQEPSGFTRESTVTIGGYRAPTTHADVAIDKEALHQPLDNFLGN